MTNELERRMPRRDRAGSESADPTQRRARNAQTRRAVLSPPGRLGHVGWPLLVDPRCRRCPGAEDFGVDPTWRDAQTQKSSRQVLQKRNGPGSFKTPVRTIRPRQACSRGRPTLRASRRGGMLLKADLQTQPSSGTPMPSVHPKPLAIRLLPRTRLRSTDPSSCRTRSLARGFLSKSKDAI